MRVCDKLKKFPHEVESLPCDEFDRLLVFYIYDAEESKKLADKNKSKIDPSKFARGK